MALTEKKVYRNFELHANQYPTSRVAKNELTSVVDRPAAVARSAPRASGSPGPICAISGVTVIDNAGGCSCVDAGACSPTARPDPDAGSTIAPFTCPTIQNQHSQLGL